MKSYILFLTGVLYGVLALNTQNLSAAADSKPADSKPADIKPTAEQQAEIDALVRQLGDDRFDAREAATEKLIKLGRVALPALRNATKHPDIEVRTRATRVLETIAPDEAAKPAEPRCEANAFFPGAGRVQIQIGGMAVNGVGRKDFRIQEDDRTVRIREDNEGVLVELTETDAAGKSVTKQFKAKSVEELKKNHPEGHELYQKYSGGGAGVFQLLPGAGAGANGRNLAPRVPLGGAARIRALDAAARKQLEEMLKKLGPQGEDILKELRQNEDLLRKLLGDAAGEEQKPRLGVMAELPDDALRSHLEFTGGVIVREVIPGSRAEKLGLREHDILLKINGQMIPDPAGLVSIVQKLGEEKLTIEGLRAGKPLRIGE